MSTTVLDRITNAQAAVLDQIDQARTPAVHLVERAVGVADRVVPVATARRTAVAPRLGDVLDRQYAFALELLKRQRTVTRAMVRAAAKAPKPTRAAKASND